MSAAHVKFSNLSTSISRETEPAMAAIFDPWQVLANSGFPIRTIELAPREVVYSQGSPANFVYYLHSGRVRLTAVSSDGKEATIALFGDHDFLGEHSMASSHHAWMATAVAVTDCLLLRIGRDDMAALMQREPRFLSFFMSYLLGRSMRMHEAMMDQIFNSSEKRLARALLMMADFSSPAATHAMAPRISHEELAAMVGTTRARISFFMNRFRKHGFVGYTAEHRGMLTICRSLAQVLAGEEGCPDCLHDGPQNCRGQCGHAPFRGPWRPQF